MDSFVENRRQTLDEVARHYDNRLGYDLIGYKEVGLPFYKISVIALFQVRKPIPPIEEFILKSINFGLSSTENICDFLGLDSQTILDAMSNLRINENIDLLPDEKGQQIWKLTKKGETTLRDAIVIIPDERTIPIYFDGLLRKICFKTPTDLLKPKEINAKNILEISPFPAKPPELGELNPKEADEVIRQLESRSKRKKDQDLIAFKSIERRERFYQSTLALVYKAKDSDNEIQVSFAIDGVLSLVHEDAFARSGQIEKLRILEQLRNQLDNPEVLAKNILSNDVIEQAKNTDLLKNELLNCRKKIEETRQASGQDDIVKQQEKRIKELEKQLENKGNSAKFLPMYEHRPLLEEALSKSKSRLLIISPWIRANATNNDLIDRLENLLKRGVTVCIGYGIGGNDEKSKNDIKAEQAVRNLAKKYTKNFYLKDLSDTCPTHAKILISDNNYAVVTSFNWLSFKGDANWNGGKFRDERGTMVFDVDEINKLFKEYSEAIAEPSALS